MTRVDAFVSLIKGRKPFPVGTVRTGKDGIKRRKAASGKWVPVKKRKSYKPGDVRTRDGKRYRMGEDGKWRRTRVKVVGGKDSRKKEVDWARQEGSMGPKKSAIRLKLERETKKVPPTKEIPDELYELVGGMSETEVRESIRQHEQHPDYLSLSAFDGAEQEQVLRAVNLGEKAAYGDELTNQDVQALEFTKSIMVPISKSATVFRGLSGLPEQMRRGLLSAKTIPLHTPVSTTTNLSYGKSWVGGSYTGKVRRDAMKSSVMLKIEVPKGTDCLVYNEDEWEIALSPDYEIKVSSVATTGEVPEISGKVVPKSTKHTELETYVDLESISDEAQNYFHMGGGMDMNRRLRNGEKLRPEDSSLARSLRSEMKPLQSNIKCYRGVLLPPESMQGLSKSDRVPVDSFLSTSTDADWADTFTRYGSEGKSRVRFEIDIPKGTNAIVTNEGEDEVVVDYDKYELVVTGRKTDRDISVVSCNLVEKRG